MPELRCRGGLSEVLWPRAQRSARSSSAPGPICRQAGGAISRHQGFQESRAGASVCGPGASADGGIGSGTAPGSMSRSIALAATRVAVMNSPLPVVGPTAPCRRNPIAIRANGYELRCGRGIDLNDWTRSGVANALVALGGAGCRCRHASHPRNGDRNNGEGRMCHDISRPKVDMFEAIPRNF